ncbi:hypothetical protein FO519_004690 [Halicephalobus sp. NKZ332]|nr:hypothetical protein FO519_004690 [Halicephalobus sp. NKZ332]
MVHYKLVYFDARGLSEPIRDIFHYLGIDFEDVRFSQEDWPKYKPDAPYGTAPWLEIDGTKLSDSMAIVQYLAKKHGLAGKTDLEAAQIHACVEFIRDFLREIRPYLLVKLGKSEGDLEKLKKDVFLPKLEVTMKKLCSILKSSGNGYLFKSGLTYADFILTELVYLLLQHEKDEVSEEPHNKPPGGGADGDDDNDEYARDGWRVGFEVEMNGVGMERIEMDQEDEGSESEGYEGPGDGSDGENDEIRRAGYQQLTMNPNVEETNPGNSEEDFERIQNRINSAGPPPAGAVAHSIKKDFKEALDAAEKVHLKDSDFVTRPGSNGLDLNPQQIETIRDVASKFTLTPPTWAKDIDDEKLKEMLNNIKAKRTL